MKISEVTKEFSAISFNANGFEFHIYGKSVDGVPYVAGATSLETVVEFDTLNELKDHVKALPTGRSIKIIDATQWTTGKKVFK